MVAVVSLHESQLQDVVLGLESREADSEVEPPSPLTDEPIHPVDVVVSGVDQPYRRPLARTQMHVEGRLDQRVPLRQVGDGLPPVLSERAAVVRVEELRRPR